MLRKTASLVLLVLSICLTGCWHTYHAQQFNDLPVSEGFNTGSFLAEPWEYYGTIGCFHYVRYTYHHNNWVHSMYLRFPTNEIQIRLQRAVPKQGVPVCAIEPRLTGGKLSAFEWKPWTYVKPRLVGSDGIETNPSCMFKPLELKIATPPRIEDIKQQP